MSEYYPYGYFCLRYGCWCDEVVDVTGNQNGCNGNCKECELVEKPERKES